MKKLIAKSETLYKKWEEQNWKNIRSNYLDINKDEEQERYCSILFKEALKIVSKKEISMQNSIIGSKSKTDGILWLKEEEDEWATTALVVEYKKRYYHSSSFSTQQTEEDDNEMEEFFGLKKSETKPIKTESGWVLEIDKFNSIKRSTENLKGEVRRETKVVGYYVNFFPDFTIALWKISDKEKEDFKMGYLERPSRNSGTKTIKKTNCIFLDINKADIVIRIEK
jgi:predicted 3-demethylubiquinone-9 3-methyltransferase (glyoxalase superfamily)